MRTILAVVAAVSVLVSGAEARTQDVTARVVEEGKSYLTYAGCNSPDGKRKCEANQAGFLREYQAAYAGDYQAQRNIGAYLAERGRIDHDIGIAADPQAACAWTMVVLRFGRARASSFDVTNARVRCNRQDVDKYAAELTAQAIVETIRRAPARMPPAPPALPPRPAGAALDGSVPEGTPRIR